MSNWSAIPLDNYVVMVGFWKPPALLKFHISGPHYATQQTVLLCPLFLADFCFIFTRNIYFFSFLVLLWLPSPSLKPNQTISLMKFESQWRKEQSRAETRGIIPVFAARICVTLWMCLAGNGSSFPWWLQSLAHSRPTNGGVRDGTVGRTCGPCPPTCNNRQPTRKACYPATCTGSTIIRHQIHTTCHA